MSCQSLPLDDSIISHNQNAAETLVLALMGPGGRTPLPHESALKRRYFITRTCFGRIDVLLWGDDNEHPQHPDL
jgi:hypothetical protein